jgi:hypothetical protein
MRVTSAPPNRFIEITNGGFAPKPPANFQREEGKSARPNSSLFKYALAALAASF